MKFQQLKYVVAIAAIVTGGILSIPNARAAVTQTITATLTSLGALDVLKVADMDFGSWVINGVGGGETIDFVKPPATGAVVATPSGTATATEIRAVTAPAELTVQIPGGTSSEDGLVVQMQRSAITDFPGPSNMTLGTIRYQTASEGPTTMATTTNVPVTITDGTALEHVFFGGTVTVSDTPPAGASTATFDVTFSY